MDMNTVSMPPPSYDSVMGTDVKKEQGNEIKEALDIAEEILIHLRKAKKNLNKAYNWGILDIVSEDCIGSMFKQGKMCDARRELIASKDALEKLNEKVKEIDSNIDTLKTGELIDFVDLFVDNIIVDVYVQGKIADAKKDCKKFIGEMEALKTKLENLL